MLVRWTPAAADDLEHIGVYLREHQPAFAEPTLDRLYSAAGLLAQFANRGRQGREKGTRELVLVPLPYVVVYAVREDAVWIVRVLHTARGRD